jgi:hypothetical protein
LTFLLIILWILCLAFHLPWYVWNHFPETWTLGGVMLPCFFSFYISMLNFTQLLGWISLFMWGPS